LSIAQGKLTFNRVKRINDQSCSTISWWTK